METKEIQVSGGGFGSPQVEDKAVRGPKEKPKPEPKPMSEQGPEDEREPKVTDE